MDPMEDSLTLEGAIGSMDFDHSDVVVTQEDITLEESDQTGDIQMGLEQIEDHSALMETGTQEVVVSDFMNQDQFSFQEYTIQTDSDSNSSNTKQSGSLINIQHITSASSTNAPNVIPIKPALQPRSVKKAQAPASMPRQVAIAPRPPNTPANVQYASVHKPVTLIMNPNNTTTNKKLVGNLVQGGVKGNTVLAQIGKQLVVVPTNTTQKIKLVNANTGESNVQYTQMVPNKGSKLVVTKLVQAGETNAERSPQQPFQNVIPNQIVSKMFAPNAPKARYVMQQKTVPISIAGTTAKVVLSSPTKQTIKVMGKKQFITINTQNTKMVSQVAKKVPTSRVIITKNPSQNVFIRSSTPKSSTQVTPSTGGQRTQLHPINVPGKGIQYIKLVTNPNQTVAKAVTKVPTLVPAKNFVLTDGKGNIIQVGGDKAENQTTPLLVSTPVSGATGTIKSSKKFVRIAAAPVGTNPRPKLTTQPVRSSQSLLVPITTSGGPSLNLSENSVSLEEYNEIVAQSNYQNYKVEPSDSVEQEDMGDEETVETEHFEDKLDDKPTLQSIIAGAVGDEMDENTEDMNSMEEAYVVEVKPSIKDQSLEYILGDSNTHTTEHDAAVASIETLSGKPEDNVMIIPHSQARYTDSLKEQDESLYSEDTQMESSRPNLTVMNVETEVVTYTSPTTPPGYSDADNSMVSGDLGVRPRKACNCTKSQCLKLYCDCFANGEFCNNCNCNNCHNNLENEELRQKAIRACLERNPNAFRPKIGKGKTTGADLIRRHNKGCNCKRSGCLKNYCECYEAKIACTSMCKCVGCRNVEETLERRRDALRLREKLTDPSFRPPAPLGQVKQPCSFMTMEVIEAVCQCLLAAAGDGDDKKEPPADPVQDVIEEFARCLQDIINASHQAL